ncbi:MAG TPA: hypothetical protein VLE43_01490 [Candidatus Saccharimonadia bacterium]|nr:hypothetical protein [Candidatus Saccharimonadia bacterium]
MSAPANIPFTVKSPRNTNGQAVVAVGNSRYVPNPYTNSSFWFLVVDRTTLQVVQNITQQSNTDVPPVLAQYDDSRYLLIVATVSLGTLRVPQGPLYAYLVANGGGVALKRIEQISSQLNCGEIATVGYCLVDILGETSSLGFELSAYDGMGPVMTLQLMPIDISGTTYWTPITLS